LPIRRKLPRDVVLDLRVKVDVRYKGPKVDKLGEVFLGEGVI
jgi:hypothetical protein